VRASRLVGSVLVAFSVAAGVILAPPVSAGPSAPQAAAPQVRVSVMTQNTFYGGDDFKLSTSDWCPVANGCPRALHRLAHIIAATGADVVGVQEPERNTRKLAHLLGWHASPRAHVISRFPILDPPHSRGIFTYVEPVPGRVIAVANTHLPSTPYGPYRVRAGWTRDRVIRLERRLRVAALAPVLHRLPRLAERGVPVFLTGDFNSPSYLDWTKAVARARRAVPYALHWPASKALADAGFGDSYRDAHPDPVADPGFTWSPGGPETQRHDFFDRIDWVLHAGPSTTVSSLLVGERGNPQVDLAFRKPYPTDHRGVVSTFDVTPAPAPLIVSPGHRRVITGDRLRAGRYNVVLTDVAHHRTEATAPVWVYRPHSRSHLSTSRRTYRVGSSIRVSWTRAPGNNLDWIGLFRCRETCGGPGTYLMYRYTRTAVEGAVTFGRHTYLGEGSVSWPLPPGKYVARLFVDDSYHPIGTSPLFRIVRR
jgi:endonuclease/exonuclease/phosphatase family metal-dependent hydrolase